MMQRPYSLDQFVYESSVARDTSVLQDHWTDFVGEFGVDGYRIVPASLQLIQQLYSLIEIESKPKLKWPIRSKLPQHPDTVIDIACKTAPGWREFYHEQQLYRYDPILTKEIVSRGPFTRDEALSEFNCAATKRIDAISREFGTNNNITMSQWFGPDTLVGVSLYLPFKKIKLDDVTKRVLQMASFLFCARYQEIAAAPRTEETQRSELTPRECDVLHWIARGKTKQEIAEILNVSVSCIKRHCENASRKLGAHNMSSTLARAMSNGLISI